MLTCLSGLADENTAPAAKRQRLQMADEYLPPNSVLFIQNLPEGTTSDDLREVFEMCVIIASLILVLPDSIRSVC